MHVSKGTIVAGLLGIGFGFGAGCGGSLPVLAEELSKTGATAFRLHRDGMNSAQIADFNYGRGLFHHLWSPVEYSDNTSSGFGPLYNANSCAGCHIQDGRGHPIEEGQLDSMSFVLRLSTGSRDVNGYRQVIPDPVYGFQFQTSGVLDHLAEGTVRATYNEIFVELAGGEKVSLRRPKFDLVDLGYGPLSNDILLGPRIAPQLIGLGYLQEIPVSRLKMLEDVNDKNGDGISGKINWSLLDMNGVRLPGRFGWKSTTTSVREQTDFAANFDMGLAAPLANNFWGDCTQSQIICRSSIRDVHFGRSVEMEEREMHLLAFYTANLRVPDRRNQGDESVVSGEVLFNQIGCASCHTPEHELESGVIIEPFTDLLLHDLGEGLSDGIEVGFASFSEWRTAPLWGIGLTEIVSGHTFFLHDGRARNLTEAIMWHAGEAENSRVRFADLPYQSRQDLLSFLKSL